MSVNNLDLRKRVFQVCEDLSGKGEKCSVRTVLSEIPEYTSTSTIHPLVREWRELQEKERDKIRERYQFSSPFMEALISETKRVNEEAIKQEKEKTELYKSLLDDTTDELLRLGRMLSDTLNKVDILQQEKQVLVTEIAVLQHAKDSEYKALNAESEELVSKYKQELDIIKVINSEYKDELTSLRASAAELKASSSHLETQLKMQQQQQDNLIAKNQDLNDEKIELAKKVAVSEAIIIELKKVNNLC
ncbi:hypothetical protein [Glaciecola sp. SC05]|jgi:chromosome segregation ATPase|uniref:hypothetical protein n=1 Tax=Glaciecola sp. SC05 TaxID=1987355 RepID=UPI003527AABC